MHVFLKMRVFLNQYDILKHNTCECTRCNVMGRDILASGSGVEGMN